MAQVAVTAWALLGSGEAARAGARAAHVGADVDAAVREALPRTLQPAALEREGPRVTVTVTAPALLPGLSGLDVSSSAALAVEAASP